MSVPFLRAAVLALSWSMAVHAQTTASLTGSVTDAGRPLPGVRVTVTSPALQGERSTTTGEAGAYHLAALPPGPYTVAFAAPSLPPLRRTVTLRLSQVERLDLALPRLDAALTVTADAPAVVDAPSVSTSLPLAVIERLPLQRNQLATAQLAPGVTANAVTNGQLQISGGPGSDNLVLVNGVVVTENSRGQMRPMYVEDAIQETTVLTGAISAELGRFTGGVVNTITRSGGNELSGSLRDSLGNPRWSAQTPARETREDVLNHVWEATLGGSVVRDRLWFFTAGRWAKNDTARQTIAPPGGTAISYSEGNDQKRYESKLTTRIGSAHHLAASYFAIDTQGTNVRFNNNIYDLASLTTRDDPESLLAAHYNGIFGAATLVEGHYSARRFSDRTGAMATDLIRGTVLLDRSNNNTRFHSPTLCGVCDVERRDNDDWLLVARRFADAGTRGTHEIAAGLDRFTERRYANNHQSGSDFSLFVTRVQMRDGVLYPVITPTSANGGGSFIRWSPLLVPAAENELRTSSAFVNEVWTRARWQLSAGVRYDRNHAVDADGVVSADDAKVSPRLALQYDLRGDGRHRLRASYGEYASRIADGVASSNQAAGNAAAIDFAYRGPAINDREATVPADEVIRMVFDSFNAMQGGTANRSASNLRPNGARSIPGYSTYFDRSLTSPSVSEWTVGYGSQLGASAYLRADVILRDWRDFQVASVTTATRRTNTPLGIPVDLTLLRNSNDLQRRYRALQLQARWSPRRFDGGVHYTWSTLRGNDEGEINLDPGNYYPEYFSYERNAPVGNLPGDQRHRLRAWLGATFGPLSVSALHSFDSALSYSIAAPVNLTRYSGAPLNPGYAAVPNGLYYFSDRGALRAGDIHSTDLAVRMVTRIARLEWFAQADVLNLFGNAGIADPQRLGTAVTTAATSAAFLPFDPARERPVECPRGTAAAACTAMGAHYQLASNFGEPLNELAYQRPRTWRISAGLRF